MNRILLLIFIFNFAMLGVAMYYGYYGYKMIEVILTILFMLMQGRA